MEVVGLASSRAVTDQRAVIESSVSMSLTMDSRASTSSGGILSTGMMIGGMPGPSRMSGMMPMGGMVGEAWRVGRTELGCMVVEVGMDCIDAAWWRNGSAVVLMDIV